VVVQTAVALVEYPVFNPFSFGTGGDGRASRCWLSSMFDWRRLPSEPSSDCRRMVDQHRKRLAERRHGLAWPRNGSAALTGRGATVLILGCCAFLHVVGCASEQVPDRAVGVFGSDDSEAQSSGHEVLRDNDIEVVGGFFFGDSSQPASYMIFVKERDQARAAELIAVDAKEKGYSVTVHFGRRTERIKSAKPRSTDQAAQAEPKASATAIKQTRPLEKQVTADLGGGVKIELVLIPAGEFMMGNTHTIEEELALYKKYDRNAPTSWFEGEYPVHPVRIAKPFYLGKHEVTVGQYRLFVRATGHKSKWEDHAVFGRNPEDWRNPGFAQTEEHPVVRVSWNDAKIFCTWLSRKEGKTYQLPTEAQWEYACRAGTTTRYFSGEDPETLAEVGNVADAAAKARDPSTSFAIKANDGYAFTAPVGKFRPNAFGCMICMATCGNGVPIGTILTTMRNHRETIRQGLEQADAVCFGVAPGTTSPDSADQTTANSMNRIGFPTTSAFESLKRQRIGEMGSKVGT
jgi:formylglycine-generating enzyme required for sulfatase activity